jgi:hypothetical protein
METAMRKNQTGMSMLAILTLLLVASFFATCAFKLVPEYLSSWTIKGIFDNGINSREFETMSVGEIRKTLTSRFNMNQVTAIKVSDVKIKRKENGMIEIDASYEKRVPLFSNIDVIIKFDYLKYEFQSRSQDY